MDIFQHLPINDVTVAFGGSRCYRRDDLDIIQLYLPKQYVVTVTGNGDFKVRISTIRNNFRAVIDSDIRDFTATMVRIFIEQPTPPNASLFIETLSVIKLQGGVEDLGQIAESGSDNENIVRPIDIFVSIILGSSIVNNTSIKPEVVFPY